MIHSTASCAPEWQDADVDVGPFTHIAEGVTIGGQCRVGGHCSIESGVVIGNGVSIGDGVRLRAGVIIEDEVCIGDRVSLFDPPPARDESLDLTPSTRLGFRCMIGAGSVLRAGVTIGEGATVEPGSVVTQSVHPHAIAAGNPARIVGFDGASETRVPHASPSAAQVVESRVRGVRVHVIPFIADPRGNLTVGEFERTLPFMPRRYFITFDVPSAHLRGEHAHRRCEQFLVCVRGTCAVVVDDGEHREEYLLDRPTLGVHVPPMIWATEYKHSPDSTLLVFASDYYDPDDYIRDYREFLREVRLAGGRSGDRQLRM